MAVGVASPRAQGQAITSTATIRIMAAVKPRSTTTHQIRKVTRAIRSGLHYKRGSFGPFSGELKAVETKLINNGLLQEERCGKMFMVTVGPNFQRVRPQYASFFGQWAKTLEKTVDLFTRVNTDQAEIIATVLFVARELKRARLDSPSETEVLESVMRWKQKRRPPLNQDIVASTIRNLAILNWLAVTADPTLPVPEEEAIPV